MIYVFAKFTLKENAKEAFLALGHEIVTETVKEEGCLTYELCQDINNANIMVMNEKWESTEALAQHSASAHFTRIIPLMSALLEKPIEVTISQKV